ncbi:MAG: SCO1664 family protein [Nostocoides sp.]
MSAPFRDVGPDLATAEIEVVGRIQPASNLALLVRVGADGPHAIYKPVSGERELWDFPDGTLAAREVAAYEISRAAGFDLVPQTVLRDGPMGPGSVQRWVGDPRQPLESVVDLVRVGAVEAGWLTAFEGEDMAGRPVAVVHRDTAPVRSMATLDAVLNNADRKGGHLALAPGGGLWGFDHGLTGHAEPKLRTVLWGWAGQRLAAVDVARLEALDASLTGDLAAVLESLLTRREIGALRGRVAELLHSGRHPEHPTHRYGIPWPPL